MAVEEGFAFEDHGGEHAAEGPHVEGVVVVLVADEEFGAFEVAGGDADVVFAAGVVEFGEAPVD